MNYENFPCYPGIIHFEAAFNVNRNKPGLLESSFFLAEGQFNQSLHIL